VLYEEREVMLKRYVTCPWCGGAMIEVKEPSEESKEMRKLQKYAEFHKVVTKILIDLHKEEIKNHPAFKAFMKKWEKEASE